METKMTELNASRFQVRKVWEEPRIVLERSLEVSAQDGPPGFDPTGGSGFLGPLSTSAGNNNTCG